MKKLLFLSVLLFASFNLQTLHAEDVPDANNIIYDYTYTGTPSQLEFASYFSIEPVEYLTIKMNAWSDTSLNTSDISLQVLFYDDNNNYIDDVEIPLNDGFELLRFYTFDVVEDIHQIYFTITDTNNGIDEFNSSSRNAFQGLIASTQADYYFYERELIQDTPAYEIGYERGYELGLLYYENNYGVFTDEEPNDGFDDASYNKGFQDGMEEGMENDYSQGWIRSLLSSFDVIFSIELLPHLSIGTLIGIVIIPRIVIGVVKWLS